MNIITGDSSELILIIVSIVLIVISVWMFGLKLKFKAGNIEISAEQKQEKISDHPYDQICRYANEQLQNFNSTVYEYYLGLMSHKAKYIGIQNLSATKEAKLIAVFYKLWKDDIITNVRESLNDGGFKNLTPDQFEQVKQSKIELWINLYINMCNEYYLSEVCAVMLEDFIDIVKIKFNHVFVNTIDEIFFMIRSKIS